MLFVTLPVVNKRATSSLSFNPVQAIPERIPEINKGHLSMYAQQNAYYSVHVYCGPYRRITLSFSAGGIDNNSTIYSLDVLTSTLELLTVHAYTRVMVGQGLAPSTFPSSGPLNSL